MNRERVLTLSSFIVLNLEDQCIQIIGTIITHVADDRETEIRHPVTIDISQNSGAIPGLLQK